MRARVPILMILLAAAALGTGALAQPADPSFYADMRWRLVGPFRGGWATCAAGVADAPQTYYFGAAAGGVWKTEDAGRTWAPIFDRAPAASIGALAIAPSDGNVIYAGTGQIQARYDIASGGGVFRSDDGGKSWRDLGLTSTRAIGRILVDAHDPNLVLVAALGHIFGPNRERGVFRSADGGKTWNHVLFVDEATGGADLAADPGDPAVVYASLWQARNYPWLSYFKPTVGPGSGIYKSLDGGRSWARLQGGGLPAGDLGRIGLATAAGGRVWALVDTSASRDLPERSGLYRSDDAGKTWNRVNATPGLASSYMNRVTADPADPDVVYVTGQSIRRSRDGGKTLEFFKGAPGGDDYHFLWINPKHPELMVTAADQGTVVTVNGGASWSDWYNQPTGQFYHVETDNRFPYWIYSGQQDSGTAGVASRSDYGSLTYRDWHPVGGEERGWDVPDPSNPEIVYGTGLGGTITRFDSRTGQVQKISPAVESTYGRRPTGDGLRWTWIFPLVVSPRPPHALYTGAQYLLRSSDSGSHWEKISPDLSGAVPGAAGCDGDVTLATARPCGFGVIFTIALSPADEREIWVGTDDGLIQLTRDAGKSWKDVTPAGLPLWGKVAALDISALEPGVVYAAVDTHRLDDFTPHLYRTRDWGEHWEEIGKGLPPSRFTTVLRADPLRRGLLYAGTDAGVQVSFDDGAHWQPLQLNLPTCWIGDLQVHGNDLVAATQGRAIWVLDDVSPLRQSPAAAPQTQLFAPAPAVRVRSDENRDTPLPPETPAGQNPPAGAVIDYYLAAAAHSPVRLEILDEQGETVRAYAGDEPVDRVDAHRYFPQGWVRPPAPPSGSAGHHRFVWDLRSPRPRASRYEYMIAAVWGDNTPIAPRGPLALPGRYRVRLTVDGKRMEQPLLVTMDPRVTMRPEDLASQAALEHKLIEGMDRSFAAFSRVRSLRAQLAKRKERAGASGAAADAIAQADGDARRLETGEAQSRRRASGGLAGVNGAMAEILTSVDAVDAPPTGVQTEGYAAASATLNELLRGWSALSGEGLGRLNAALKSAGIPVVKMEDLEREPPPAEGPGGTEVE